jgi:hypothetical protein
MVRKSTSKKRTIAFNVEQQLRDSAEHLVHEGVILLRRHF